MLTKEEMKVLSVVVNYPGLNKEAIFHLARLPQEDSFATMFKLEQARYVKSTLYYNCDTKECWYKYYIA